MRFVESRTRIMYTYEVSRLLIHTWAVFAFIFFLMPYEVRMKRTMYVNLMTISGFCVFLFNLIASIAE